MVIHVFGLKRLQHVDARNTCGMTSQAGGPPVSLMFVQLQFPLVDLRGFVDGQFGRLPVPEWPSPDEDGFVRGLGPICFRPRGGISNWILEAFVCDIHALRLHGGGKKQKLVFCRLFSDGLCVTKVDIGLDLPGFQARELLSDPAAFKAFLTTVFSVNLRHSATKTTLPLSQFQPFLKKQYTYATTPLKKSGGPLHDGASEYICCGNPVVFLEHQQDFTEQDTAVAPLNHFQKLAAGILVRFASVQLGGHTLPVWQALRTPAAGNTKFRTLRIALTRVQTEIFCMRAVLSAIERGLIAPARGSEARNCLHSYLEAAKHRITLDAVMDSTSADILQDAAAAYNNWLPAYIGSILERLAHLELKRNIYLDTANAFPLLDKNAADAFFQGRSINFVAKQVIMSKTYKGQFGVINETGTVSVRDINQTQSPQAQTAITFDSAALAADLAKVIAQGKAEASTAGEFDELATLAKAKDAADRNNQDGVISALKAAGTWTADIAAKVSASILTELIKKQTGI